MSRRVIKSIEAVSAGPMKTLDPFIFCVYHQDFYPAGDGSMRAPRRGNGADFNPSAPYRMYHGDDIPGFPQHPHRGFETVTATLKGLVDHTDSKGNAGRYGNGDLQWLTAGAGIVHGEMMPLVHSDRDNTLQLFQIWLNLPAKKKMTEPAFVMHWAEDIPKFISEDGKVKATIFAGSLFGRTGLPPTPESYANQPDAEVGIWFFNLAPGGQVVLPPAAGGQAINRVAYFLEGDAIQVEEQTIRSKSAITLDASQEVRLSNPQATGPIEILVLQGRPIGEPVVAQGPFVMNSQEEIQQAYADYRRTRFGGWPWPKDAMVFPAEKGRFALVSGKELLPPAHSPSQEL